MRHGLNKDLGFLDADRIENIEVGEVAKLMTDGSNCDHGFYLALPFGTANGEGNDGIR